MPTLRFGIRKSNSEWDKLCDVVTLKYRGKNSSPRGNGLSRFIAMELTRVFHDADMSYCEEIKVGHTKKDFTINITSDLQKKILCHANKLGIDPATLVARMILDPHLLDVKKPPEKE